MMRPGRDLQHTDAALIKTGGKKKRVLTDPFHRQELPCSNCWYRFGLFYVHTASSPQYLLPSGEQADWEESLTVMLVISVVMVSIGAGRC